MVGIKLTDDGRDRAGPKVSIGLPTYNRPELLSVVLDDFRRQSFGDFELIISDNASPDDRVRQICLRAAEADPRIRYVRQPANTGAEANFWFVFDAARAPLFLWASDDDRWPAGFLERGVAALQYDRNASAWFCQVENITTSGLPARRYPSFKRFASTRVKLLDLAKFLWEPEVLGKANLIYSIFRKEALRDTVCVIRSLPSSWGADMNLVYGFLCRHRIVIDDSITVQKRLSAEMVDQVIVPRYFIYPSDKRAVYFENYRKVAAGSGYAAFTSAVLFLRFRFDNWFHWRAEFDVRKIVRRWIYELRSSASRLARKIWSAISGSL